MPRYDTPGGDDAQYEPGSDREVLRNLVGVTTRREMDTLEAQALLRAQNRFFDGFDLTQRFTTDTLLSMHRDWLEDIYPFAGKLRNVDIAKGNLWFAAVQFLESTFATFGVETLGRLTPCGAETIEDAASAMAGVHGEFIAVHPFREGNGRIGRWLADAMALQADLPYPSYGFTPGGANGTNSDYLEAVKLAVARADFEGLKRFFAEALRRAL